MNTNISTIIENGIVKEINARTYSNISKQEYLKQTDKDIYNQNNYLKEEDLLGEESEINVTNPNDTINKNVDNVDNEHEINTTGVI